MFPPPIQHEISASALEADLQSGWPEVVSLKIFDQMSWYELPYYFLPAFPSLDASPARVRPLASLGRLLANSMFIHDGLVDCDARAEVVAKGTLRIMAMQFEAYRIGSSVFQPDAAFWDRLRGYLSEYAAACLEEVSFASGARSWREYDEETALRIAVGLSGASRAIIAGLVDLSGDGELLEPLVRSLNHFNIACHLWDDLKDWKEDLSLGAPSLVLSRAGARPLKGTANADPRPTLKGTANADPRPTLEGEGSEALRRTTDRLAREIYYDGHATYILDLALASLRSAEQLKEKLPDLPWYRLTDTLLQKYGSVRNDIERMITRNMDRARRRPRVALRLPAEATGPRSAAWAGVRYLVSEWQRGFGEARDVSYYSDDFGFDGGAGCQVGDVFQRALVVDALADADAVLGGQLSTVIKDETDYLLGRRLTTGVGGWAYFQDLPELPPDADDLAQVIQALLRAGRRPDVNEFCERPIEAALSEGAVSNGALKTWIIPVANRTPLEERQAEFTRRIWGDGCHDEVVANLLYALHLYDAARFATAIRRGAEYLETRQHEDGTWTSGWYCGPYYAVYACARFFAAVKPESPALARALELVRRRQRPDGGWGMDGEGTDALNTALCSMTLAAASSIEGAHRVDDSERAREAHELLAQRANDDGSWARQKLICVGNYGSRTVTTAFVVRALLVWQSLESDRERTATRAPSSIHRALEGSP